MYFRELHQRLIDVARERVRAGEFTERALARIAEVSQPHMHNVLKGIRALSPDSADRLMRALRPEHSRSDLERFGQGRRRELPDDPDPAEPDRTGQ